LSVEPADYLPEILLLIRDFVMKTRHPLGMNTKQCDWCREVSDKVSEESRTLIYGGCLYNVMGFTHKLSSVLGIIMKEPTKEARLKILRRLRFLSSISRKILKESREYTGIPVMALEILDKLGYEVRCLNEEPYSGALLYDLGFWNELKEYGSWLTQFFKERGVERIIVLDPHTYDLFAHVYPEMMSDFDFEIINFIDIILEEVKTGKLSLSLNEKTIVTYHDPCHYSRSPHRRIIDEPREILNSIEGVELREPSNTKNLSECCGGPLEFIFPFLSEEVAKMRFNELMNTGAKYIVTACPICQLNFYRAAKKHKESKIIDIIELVYHGMRRWR